MIEATVVCDSVSKQDKRLTTFKLRYPKFIHGEFMTHRVISRNASSSRAIPTSKLMEEVRSDALRAGPVWWGKNQPGMQAAEELTGDDKVLARAVWAAAARNAAMFADDMLGLGAHKQIVNRLLEPFSHINVVATATEWDNFFGLRLHKDAQPEMRALAIAMWEARGASTPRALAPGEWHLPFVWKEGGNEEILDGLLPPGNPQGLTPHEQMLRVSVARCARVSYESFETGRRSSVEEDIKLYDRLLSSQPLHASPAEHQATPDGEAHLMNFVGHDVLVSNDRRFWGNFIGWNQYRKMLEGEAVAPLPEGYA